MTHRRFPRSRLEAFPQDHWRDVVTHYRRPLSSRVWDVILCVAIFGSLGVILAKGIGA